MRLSGFIWVAALGVAPAYATERLPHYPSAAPAYAGGDERPVRVRISTAAHDTGSRFPMVDIYPTLPLAVPGTLDMPAIQRQPWQPAMDGMAPSPRPTPAPAPILPGNRTAVAPIEDNAATIKIAVTKTGVFTGRPVPPR